MNEKAFVSKTVRRWFNRNRSQKEEENLDMSDITSTGWLWNSTNREDYCDVVARQ